MNEKHKEILKQHAQHFYDMAAFVVTRDNDELAELKAACAAATQTNCSWALYRAARYLAGEIEGELHQRLKNRAAAADSTRTSRTEEP